MQRVLSCLLAVMLALAARAAQKQEPRPTVISLKPFGIPKGLFSRLTVGCRHEQVAGTRLFWLGTDRIFVAFTTNVPCTFRAHEDAGEVRAIVFDTKGHALATHAWPVSEDSLNLFPGPKSTVIFRHGARLDVYGSNLETIESGELDQIPRGLWVTPHRKTIPLLSADGHRFEFYQPDPLDQVSTIALDQSKEANAIKDWIPGDERVAGSDCSGASQFTCSRIIVLTADAQFLSPDGAPWSFEDPARQVSLKPVGFLDPQHLVVIRQEKGFFHGPLVQIVRPNGTAMDLPSPGARFTANRIVGVTADANRFALEFLASGNCDGCIGGRYYSVTDADGGKPVFEASVSPDFGDGEMSPDGKAFALLDAGAITIYPLP